MKALRTAAFVVGAVALVATGVGALGSAGLLGAAIAGGGSIAGIATAATLTTIGTIAGAAAALATLAAGTPKGSIGGSATQFKIDKDAGLPVAIGRTYSGGNVVHRQYYGSKNSLESWVTVHSIGPVRSLGPLLINKVATSLNGTAVGGSYSGYMWLDQQLGACPETRAMTGPQGAFAGWGSTSRLSGLAADLWTLKYDDKGKIYPNGVPQRGRIVEGVYVYDPRLDSTYAGGGSGACRLGQEATYVWSENPALHAITWAFGRYQNGVLIAGGGIEADGIDMAPFVDWANVCDANNWKVGGVVYTTSDNSWDILKMLAQAGGGEVFPVGAQLSCSFNAPRVSIGTIVSNDITGDVDVPGTASRRQRRNTVIARVRLESHGWEEVPLDAVAIADYVAADGGSRPSEVTFPLVQQVDQGAQLGLYTVFNGRELDGIVLPCKVYALGYRPGDCLTVDIPEAALSARDVVIRNREIEGSTMTVTLTCRSETHSKHPFCLGKTGAAPPTPDLSVPPSYPLENASALQLAIATSFPIGLSLAALDDGSITISNHTRRYTDGHADVAVKGTTIVSRPPATLVAQGAVSIASNFVTKTGTTAGWDAGAYSQQSFSTPFTLRFKIGQNAAGFHAGLNADPTTNASYDTIDYAWNGWSDGVARVYIGTVAAVVVGNYTAADVFAIQYAVENGQGIIRWFMNDVQAHQINVSLTQPLSFDSSIYASGQSIKDVTLSNTDALEAGDFRAIYYDDADRVGGTVAYGLSADDINARASPNNPYRHYVGYVSTPTAGSPPASGGGATPPGGNCPVGDTPILMADRTSKRADALVVGDEVFTRHEVGFGWGVYPVEAVSIVESDDVWQATVGGRALRATGDHLVYTGKWVAMRDIGEKLDGSFSVVKITVASAHTYVSNGILSHNIKATQPDQ